MKSLRIVCIVFALLCARSFGQETYPGGIVYGPKAAFSIAAPNGWVLDNQAGVEQGLPCVLYPKGESWADARTVMYAKIASTEFEDVNAFVAFAIKGMKAKRGLPKEKMRPARRKTAAIISSMNIRRRKIIRSGNAWPMCNCRTLSLTSCSRRAIRRATARILPRCKKR
jgi:hypothetical protein